MTTIQQALHNLIKEVRAMRDEMDQQAVRLESTVREGRIVEVDPSRGVAVVDAHGVTTGEIPWMQQAGSVVDWEPPRVGQRVVVISPGGDIGRGFIMPGGFTDETPQPYSEGEMFGRKIGGTEITGTVDSYKVKTARFEIQADQVVINGQSVQINGDTLRHNEKNVGHDHTHGGVVPGGANTDGPNG